MSVNNAEIQKIVNSMGSLDETEVIKSVEALLKKGMPPIEVQRCINIGIELVTRFYQSGEYYLADIIYAGYIYRKILHMKDMQSKYCGREIRVAVGSINNDIHNIGKSILISTLKSYGFKYIDAGNSVNSGESIQLLKEFKPHIIALSCNQISTKRDLKKTVSELKSTFKNITDLKVIIGGNSPLADNWQNAGADKYIKNEIEFIEYCLALRETV